MKKESFPSGPLKKFDAKTGREILTEFPFSGREGWREGYVLREMTTEEANHTRTLADRVAVGGDPFEWVLESEVEISSKN